MRIAFVHSFYSSRNPSGENRAVEAEASALRKAGHEVRVYAARTDDTEGSPIHPMSSALRVATGIGRSPLKDLQRDKPDVVHIHNLFPNWGSRWIASLEVPMVTTLHNFRPLCANGLLFRDGGICTLCPDGERFAGVKHKCYRDSRPATLPLALANRKGPSGHPALRFARRVIVLSERSRSIYVQAGIPSEHLVVWPNFLPSELDPGWGGDGEGEGWLYVGRLSPEKGIGRLVEDWPADRPLTLMGDGIERARCEEGARGKAIQMVGLQDRPTIIAAMRRSVGLVFPSLCLESFPLVYAEAMAAGLPVLAWKPNVLSDSTAIDGTGASVSWEQDLTTALTDAERLFPGLRPGCRGFFDARLSEEAYVARAVELYASILHSWSE